MKYQKTKILIGVLMAINGLASSSFAKFEVHEWGTFTSVQGSDGNTLSHLEIEEEVLPPFVHNRTETLENGALDGCQGCPGHCCKMECCDDLRTPANLPVSVTQKMETPVLYFYSDVPRKVDVRVDFPKGLISQFYPKPTTVLPTLSTQVLANGSIQYSKLEVLAEPVAVPPVIAGNVYGPARNTKANFVRMNGETEKFVFYRGLGDFKTSLKVTSNATYLNVKDTFGNGIPFMLAVNVRNGKGAFKVLGSLTKSGQNNFAFAELNQELEPRFAMTDFESKVAPVLVTALQNTGLFKEEAESMVNTWRLSYFHTEGLRVLYVLPRVETDALLPLQITPSPEKLVRTLVGRVEVMTTQEETSLLSEASKALKGESSQFVAANLGRFREPKLSRLMQLTSDANLQNYLEKSFR